MRFALSEAEREGFGAVRAIVGDRVGAAGLHQGAPLAKEELQALFLALAPLGYLGSTLARADGGHALSPLAFGALVEALAPEYTLLGNHSVQRYLAAFGSDAQKRAYLPSLLDGSGIGAIAITERDAGSDLAALSTTATPKGDVYVIDGEKTWVTHGLVASLFVVLARSPAGLTRFLIGADTPGLSLSAMHPIGLCHLSFARLRFEHCEVPASARLGGDGEGAAGAKSAFPLARVLAGLQALRLAESAIENAMAYARERKILGAALDRREIVQDGLARLLTEHAALRLLAYRSLCALEADGALGTAAGLKAAAADLALKACRFCAELQGSDALDTHARIHALERDARMMAVVDGTSVLNRLVLGRRPSLFRSTD